MIDEWFFFMVLAIERLYLKPTCRMCGDYKCAVNQVSKLDNYPIPKTKDLLASLSGGEKFTQS